MFRDGTFPLRQFPFVVGLEAAGVVDAVGPDVQQWKVGDRVAYWTSLGAYADVRLVDADDLVPVPDSVSLDVAAAILTKSLLAWVSTHRLHRNEPGRTVVVGPAAGGVGSLLSRWAHNVGATVIATVCSRAEADTLADAGFDHVSISPTPGAAAPEIRELVYDRGVDVLYDGVGGSGFDQLWRSVRPGGKVILFGAAAGRPDL